MEHLFKTILFSLVGFVFISCEKEYEPLPALEPFSNERGEIYMHRVNKPEEAVELLKIYPGVEIDVFFDQGENNFFIQREEDQESSITLEYYFKKTKKYQEAKYWIDYKNLTNTNVIASIGAMYNLTLKYGLQDRIKIESKNAEPLSMFSEAGFSTSFWAPGLNLETLDTLAAVEETKKYLSKYQFNAISGQANMQPIFEKYFSKYNHHYWINFGFTGLWRVEEILESPQTQILLYSDREVYKKI